MPLSAHEQFAINEQAAQGDWSQDRIDAATREAEKHSVTAQGAEELAHVERMQTEHDEQLKRGLAITAEQGVALDNAAAQGDWDQERIDKAKAAMAASNTHEQ